MGRISRQGKSTEETFISDWTDIPALQLKNVDGITGDAAREKADSSKDVQDEYLEWSVERLHVRGNSRDTGPIKRVVFTCEGPEVRTQKSTSEISTKKSSTGNSSPVNKWIP